MTLALRRHWWLIVSGLIIVVGLALTDLLPDSMAGIQ